jgi:hypothetical protein
LLATAGLHGRNSFSWVSRLALSETGLGRPPDRFERARAEKRQHFAPFGRPGRRHSVPAIVEQRGAETGLGWVAATPLLRPTGEALLERIPESPLNDRRVLPVMNLTPVSDPAGIDRVRQDPVQMAAAEATAPRAAAGPVEVDGNRDALTIEAALSWTTLPISR